MQNAWAVLAAVALILVLSVVQQMSGPTASMTRIEANSDGDALRTALGELRQLRAQVSLLDSSVRAIKRDAAAAAANGRAAAKQPQQSAALRPQPATVSVHTSSSSAPTSFLDAVSLDDGRPASNLSVLAPVLTTQPDCGMLLFRHIEKTGGTTFRMHMIAHYACGWHVWGYKGTIRLCNKAKAEYEMIEDPRKRPPVGEGESPLLPKLVVESHAEHGDFMHMMDKWVPMVRAWHGTCGMWLVTILREPLKRQVSHFSYHKTTRGFDIKHIHNFTQYFAEQNPLLNRRSITTQFLQRHILLPRLLDKERAHTPRTELELHVKTELDKYDVIGLFENYTASMLLIARATGMPLSKYSVPSTVKNRDIKVHRDKVKQIWADELATDGQRKWFLDQLELDYWIYNDARRRFDALVKEGGAEYAAQLRELYKLDASTLDANMEKVCMHNCDAGFNKEQATNRFVWKGQQCWPPAVRELASCGKNPHLKPDFNPALCG